MITIRMLFLVIILLVICTKSSNTSASNETKSSTIENSTSTFTSTAASATNESMSQSTMTQTVDDANVDHTKQMETENTTNESVNVAADNTSTTNTRLMNEISNPNDELQNRYGILIYSSVFFSNGDLTPETPYPKDPYNATFWKQGLNQLTNMGKTELYELGFWLAKRYSGLLRGGSYNSQLTKIDSGIDDYMFEGAACLAAGLFPPIGDQKWDLTLNWQPVSIQINTAQINNIITLFNTCHKYDEEINRVRKLIVWQKYNQIYKNTFDVISNGTGLLFHDDDIFDNMKAIFNLYLELTAEKNNNLTLPFWTTNVYPQPMENVATKYLELLSYSSIARKYKAGPLLQSIINKTQNKIDGNITENLQLYSGNVIGLSSIMNGLGVFNSQMPLTASALLIELRKRNADYIITVSIKNGTGQPFLLEIPNCRPVCLFHQFLNITANMTSENWNDECNKIFVANVPYSTPLLIAGLIVLIVLFFLFALLFIKLCRCVASKKGKLSYNK